MGFHEVRFPDDISYGSDGGPGYNTNIIEMDSGDGARYAVLTDDNVVIADRQVIAVWDLVSAKSATEGHPITLEDCEFDAV